MSDASYNNSTATVYDEGICVERDDAQWIGFKVSVGSSGVLSMVGSAVSVPYSKLKGENSKGRHACILLVFFFPTLDNIRNQPTPHTIAIQITFIAHSSVTTSKVDHFHSGYPHKGQINNDEKSDPSRDEHF